ncbi:MAG: penicillin-binding protein 2 [Gammaproteobacteria bacterium]|nr:MAG: penicillin-binding protein 2 [Gammaproteobacteria bacterium]
MGLNFTLKDTEEESRLIRLRVYSAVVIIILLVMVLVARLFYLQVIRHDHFITLSQSNRVKVLPIAPIRGLIFSRDNVLLADNQPSFSLELIPEQIDNLDKTIGQLSRLIDIDEDSISRFKKLRREKRRFESIPLKFNLSEGEVARFSVERHKIPGAKVIARPYRYYPEKSGLVHALGYVARIDEKDLQNIDESDYLGTTHIGKLGVEKAYEDILHGRVGHQQVEVNAQGRIIRVLERTPPEPGQNIYLTLDLSLQTAASKIMQGKRGSIVAMDPDNGDILAFVSSPAYDPNPFVNGIDSKSYKVLLSSRDTPLINRALNGKYPPGSTVKPFLGIAALMFGVRNTDEAIWCRGWYTLRGHDHRYRDWKKGGHGHVDLNYAIMQSCDIYFYTLAHDLGITKLNRALTNFGFGVKTGIDIGGESAALVPSIDWKRSALNQPWYPGETLIAGIGQGYVLATPLQLVTATAALANHGKRVLPRLVYKISDPISGESTLLPVATPTYVAGYKQEHWDFVIQAMQDVVHGPRGTARRSGANAAYRFAGKTGTSQLFGIGQDVKYEKDKVPEHLRDHALFIAFAPLEAPKIALAIIVENGGSGSSTAAPIARKLLDHYLLDESGNLK